MGNDGVLGPDDFIDPALRQVLADLFNQMKIPLTAFSQDLKTAASELKNGLGQTLPETEAKIKLLNSALKETTKGTRDYFEIRQQLSIIEKAEKDTVQNVTSAYASLNQQYVKARDNARDLAVIHGVQSDAAKKAAAEALALNNQLKSIDASVGSFQRNVGNYTESWQKYGRAAAGLAGISKLLGEAIGLNTEAVKVLGDAHSVLRETVRDGSHAQEIFKTETEASTVATEAQTAATEEQSAANTELTASNEEVGASWLASAGLIGLAALAIAGIIYEIYELVEANKELKDFNKILADGEKELIELREKAFTAQQKLDISSGKITKYDAEKQNINIAQQKEFIKVATEHKKALDDLGARPEERINNAGSVYNTKEIEDYDNRKIKLEQQTQDKLDSIQEAGDAARANVDAEAKNEANKKQEKDLSRLREIELLKDDFIKKDLQRELAKLATERKFDIIEIEKDKENYDTKGKLTDLARQKISEINQIYDLKDDAARLNHEAEQDKKRAEHRKKEKEEEAKSRAEQEKANKDAADGVTKHEEDFQKLKEKIRQQGLKLPIEQDKAKEQSDIDNNANPNVITNDKIKTENDSYYNTTQDTKKKYEDEIKQANDLGMDTTDIIKQYHEQQEVDSQTHENTLTEIKKQGIKTRMEALQKEAEQTLAAFKEVLAAQNQQQLESLRSDAQMLSTEAQVQAQLAAAGKKNSLDAVLKAQADNAEQQKQLERKQKQEQDAITYSELFAKAVSANIGAGQPMGKALAGALETVFATKALAAGLGAGFYEGTEDTGTGGRIDAKGGFISILHPHERVIDADKNAMLGGVSNEDLVNGYLLNMMLPKVPVSDNNKNDELATAMLTLLDGRLKSIEDTIKKQPQKIAYTNGGGDTVIEETVNGSTHTRIKKNYRIIKTK